MNLLSFSVHLFGCKATLPIFVMVPRSQSNITICSMPLLGLKFPYLLGVFGSYGVIKKQIV